MDRVKIEAEGPEPHRVRVTRSDTGENLGKTLLIQGISIDMGVGRLTRATLEIVGPHVLIDSASADYRMRHPDGGIREVSRIEYRDGTSIDFPAPNTLPAED
ncbi:hypothetical protein [Pseudoroseomonas ludipueritiae]|uniref:Uncharacterized protein n=1 Tax=Pseudoroseomonas ludipueritiae TaxID=198093 RepID=A0ABR7R4U7_9PROT|nr:hypothetical protein [Pseudoroseomonas ludipueritiae]MBC9176764.1 hypothetical protein [Pseudoroseomonas ludipueritiae]